MVMFRSVQVKPTCLVPISQLNNEIRFEEGFQGIIYRRKTDGRKVLFQSEIHLLCRRMHLSKQRNVQLIGLSIDSVHSHLAWLQDIEKMFGTKVPFPVIADLDMKVSHLYGMIHPKAATTAAVRAVFVIDDKGILRAMLYYPMSAGRNISEILRLIDSLQTTDKHGNPTPENWNPGEPVIVPPPTNSANLETELEAQQKGLDFKSWYLRFKNL